MGQQFLNFFSKLKYSLLYSQQIFVFYRLFSYTIILTLVFQEKKEKAGGEDNLSWITPFYMSLGRAFYVLFSLRLHNGEF